MDEKFRCEWCKKKIKNAFVYYVSWYNTTLILCSKCEEKLNNMNQRQRKAKIKNILNENGG